MELNKQFPHRVVATDKKEHYRCLMWNIHDFQLSVVDAHIYDIKNHVAFQTINLNFKLLKRYLEACNQLLENTIMPPSQG